MKHFKLYLTALLFAAAGITSCEDDWDTPPMYVPQATIEANTSIYDLKNQYWFDDNNGVDTVGLTASGEHVVIKGRVISSDEAGNVYKNLVIQDETAAITFSINQNSLYTFYRPGQEIVIDVTDMYIGKYAGLQQFGMPEYKEQFGWQTTFMPLEHFKLHAQPNGMPEPDKINTIVTTIGELPTTKEGIIKMQSQLVRFENVKFENGGKATFAEEEVTKSQNITDGNATLAVRTSGYANFYSKTLPVGEGSVTGILGYFNGSWQLTLRSYEDCDFPEPEEGSEFKPFSVASAIAAQGQGKSGWVKGYIVGALAPGKSEITSNSDIEWKAPFTLPNTIVIADAPNVNDYTKCIVMDLVQGSELREKVNLPVNPDNLGAEISLKGNLEKVYGMAGITGNGGSAGEFIFTSIAAVTSIDENFDTYSNEINNLVAKGWTLQRVKGNKDWFLKFFELTNNTYASITGYKGKAPFDTWLITPAINVSGLAEKVFNFRAQVNGYGSKTSVFEVYVLTSNNPADPNCQMTKLNVKLPVAPGSGYSEWVNSGNIDLSAYSGKIWIGWRYQATEDAEYATWCIDDVLVGKKGADVPIVSDNDGSLEKPYTAADIIGGVAGNDVWATGYIVGYASTSDAASSAVFDSEGAKRLNVLVADSPDVKDVTKCYSVGFSSGPIRDALNLQDNPKMLGQKITVKGDLMKVFGINGIKELKEFKK